MTTSPDYTKHVKTWLRLAVSYNDKPAQNLWVPREVAELLARAISATSGKVRYEIQEEFDKAGGEEFIAICLNREILK